jgi:dTDP-4-amino-4,6-dideoxygalactose transaminase
MSKLAFFGGEPLVPPGSLVPEWPIVTKEDIYAVGRVLESGRFTGIYHPENEALEREYAAYVGARHCLTYVNGTVVLHGAVAAAGIGPGDEVLVPALTFLASASSVLFHQGIPIFVDIDPVTFNMDPAAIEASITDHTRGIMVVHLHGLPCDMEEINAIARKHNLIVIEDNAHAAGAEYRGVKTGNLADMSGGSIIMGKNLPTCGEGGLFTTNRDDFRDTAAKLREFGELYSKTGDRTYNPDFLGWNYRINVFNAAFTRSQLKRLDHYSRLRQQNVAAFEQAIGDLPAIVPPHVPADRTHVYHIYRLGVAPERMGIDVPAGRLRRALQDIICAEGLPVGYYERMPVPSEQIFQNKRGYGKGCPWDCPHSRPGIEYRTHDYPQTLQVIETTFMVGHIASPTYDRRIMDCYADILHKVFEHRDEVIEYARSLDYRPPWEETGAGR